MKYNLIFLTNSQYSLDYNSSTNINICLEIYFAWNVTKIFVVLKTILGVWYEIFLISKNNLESTLFKLLNDWNWAILRRYLRGEYNRVYLTMGYILILLHSQCFMIHVELKWLWYGSWLWRIFLLYWGYQNERSFKDLLTIEILSLLNE